MAPPPTEAELLESFLLTPAPLHAILSFDQFRALFPRAVHDSPLLRSLFRDLRDQRGRVTDTVAASIEVEAQRGGQAIRREVARQRREEVDWEVDGEVEMDRALFASDSAAKQAKHSLDSILPELAGATDALETEIQKLEQQEADLREEIAKTIGDLSDLRTGNLANQRLPDDVLAGLDNLREVCDRKT